MSPVLFVILWATVFFQDGFSATEGGFRKIYNVRFICSAAAFLPTAYSTLRSPRHVCGPETPPEQHCWSQNQGTGSARAPLTFPDNAAPAQRRIPMLCPRCAIPHRGLLSRNCLTEFMLVTVRFSVSLHVEGVMCLTKSVRFLHIASRNAESRTVPRSLPGRGMRPTCLLVCVICQSFLQSQTSTFGYGARNLVKQKWVSDHVAESNAYPSFLGCVLFSTSLRLLVADR